MANTNPLSSQTTKPTSEMIRIASSKHGEVTLTSQNLEQWFAKLERNSPVSKPTTSVESDSYLATLYLSRFGLKSSAQVIRFLNSTQGKAIVAMINEELAEIGLRNELTRQQIMDQQIRKERLLGALLLGLLYDEAAQAEQIARNEETDQKLLKLKESKSPIVESAHAKEAAHEHYLLSLQAIEDKLTDKLKESKELETQLKQLEQEEEKIIEKYEILERYLDELEDHFDVLDVHQRQQHIAHVQRRMQEVRQEQQRLDPNSPRKGQLEQEYQHLSQREKNLENISAVTSTEEHIQKLQNLLTEKQNQISTRVGFPVERVDDRALQVVDIHSLGLMSQVEMIARFIDYLNGARLQPSQKMVVQYGRVYVLDRSQSLDNLSPEEKQNASERAQTLRPNFRLQLTQQKESDLRLHREKHRTYEAQAQSLQSQILLLGKQKDVLTDSLKALGFKPVNQQVSTTATAVPISDTRAIPNPRPRASVAPSPKPTSREIDETNTYRHILSLLKTSPTVESVKKLKQELKGPDGARKIPDEINQNLKEIKGYIKRQGSIPDQTMNNLLENIKRFSLFTTGRGLTPTVPAPTTTAPSPFDTKPKPVGR